MDQLHAGRHLIARETEAVAQRLARVPADAWDGATRLEGWTVADLARHLVWGQRLQAGAWRRLLDDDLEVAPPPPVTTRDPVQLCAEFREARDAFLGRLDEATEADLERLAPLPYGTVPGAVALATAVMEASVHHADLEDALGGDGAMLPDDATPTAAMVAGGWLAATAAAAVGPPTPPATIVLDGGALTTSLHHDGTAWAVVDGHDPTTRISGSPAAVVLFALGRLPASHPSLTVEGDEQLAAEFKAYFPGP